MQEMTDGYRNEVLKLVDGGILSPRVLHPWQENRKLDESKVRVINFTSNLNEGTVHVSPEFNQARDLSGYLSDSLQQPNRSNRRPIVVEGLEPRMLEVIGVKFRVPPSFFLGHCDLATKVNIVDQECNKASSVYWRVTVPQTRKISIQRIQDGFGPDWPGWWSFQVGNVERFGATISESRHYYHFYNLVSYWGIEYPGNKGGWTGKHNLLKGRVSNTCMYNTGIHSSNI